MANERDLKQSPDARFRFALSEDGMKLGVSRYFPPNGGEEASVELLRQQVAQAGVRLPIDENAAQQIVDHIKRTGDIRRTVLVQGTPVQEPENASLMALGDLKFPVFPGDRFARKNGPHFPQDGETIDGRVIKPKENFEPEDIEIKMGENVELDPLTGSFVSQVWGMARYMDGEISVEPIPTVTEDELAVVGTLHHRDFKGRDITPAQVEKEMRDIGVVIDIDSNSIDRKIRQAKAAGSPLFDIAIVEGKHPVPGRDGWFEYLVSSREETGTEDDAGRLDFRDRGMYPMVTAGQVVGRLHPPTAGEGGIDVYGKTIPASGGKELHVHLGENVFVHDDKMTFESKAKGVVSMEKGVLSVTDCLIVAGDVDIGTGNVKLEHGSVKIMGSIQAGAVVSAPKHVLVGGSVESATVYAGGSVEVKGGILMADGGSMTAEGDVSAGYTNCAKITAGGDVYIANDVNNSEIHADGMLYAIKGKGHVQGGHIITAKGMMINEVGSELGVATRLTVRIEHADDEGLRQERVKVKQAIARVDEALGNDSAEAILKRTPPEKRQAVAEVLKHRITLVKRRKAISEQINQLMLERQEELAGIKVKVGRAMHPGAVIKIGASVFEVPQYTPASVLYWSDSHRSIVVE